MLGASNLTRSFATVVETMRLTWNEPVEIMAAMGHGRSYGRDSAVLGRKIPGIFPCALWRDLQRRPPLPTAALMTDIGNDLLYGVPLDRLFDWVESCLDRLVAVDATIVVTQLPLGSLARLGETRFRLFRRLMFSRSSLSLSQAMHLANLTNERALALGDWKNTSVIPVSDAWYGFDPIHLKRRAERQAWPAFTSSWRHEEPLPTAPRPGFLNRAYLSCLAPLEQSIWGVLRHRNQPCGYLNDGTTISLY